MNIIVAPIVLGQQGTEVQNLQETLFWCISQNLLTVSNPDTINAMADEMAKSFFGSNTLAILNDLKTLIHIVPGTSKGVNEDDAEKINIFIRQNQENDALISGRIYNQNGFPLYYVQVKLYAVQLKSRTLLQTVNTDQSGYFEYRYTVVAHTGIQADIIIPELAQPLQSEIYFTAQPIYFELTAPIESSTSIGSEFELLDNSVVKALNGAQLTDLTLDDLNFLVRATGENEQLLKLYILAFMFRLKISASHEIYYGIMRILQLESLELLVNQTVQALTDAAQYAVTTNRIPYFSTDSINSEVAQIKAGANTIIMNTAGEDPADSRAYQMLSWMLDPDQVVAFLSYYYNGDTSDPRFWDEDAMAAAIPRATADSISSLKQWILWALIAGNNFGMMQKLSETITDIWLLTSVEDWKTQIMAAMNDYAAQFVWPDYIPDSWSQEDKIDYYAQALKRNFTNTFRGFNVVVSITNDSASPFTLLQSQIYWFARANPQFDMLATPSNTMKDGGFDFTGVSDVDGFIDEIATVQRLSVVHSDYTVIAAMKSAGMSSALDVLQVSNDDFVAQFQGVIGSSSAAGIAYGNAVTTVMTAQAASMNAYQFLNLNIPVIYTQSATALPDWRSLFGTVDFCTCGDCMSVFSPAAYLVDSLELLRKYNDTAYKWLRAKRPDLWNLKLTCKNTNTALPYIDLANEILEDMMLASGTNAVLPPNPYLYPISAHDTTLDEKTLDTIPQYINVTGTTTPYTTLLGAKYPWTAPYNYFFEQTREYLGLIDVKPYQAPQTFGAVQDAFTLANIELACSFLGITMITPTQGEYAIIVDNTSTLIRSYYGVTGANIIDPSNRNNNINVPSGSLVPVSPASPFLNRVDIFMQQSGLDFTDVLELLDCYYINPVLPTSPVSRHLSITSTPVTGCDPSTMVIAGLTEGDLLAIHRFIRLQRKTGWSKYELDQAFTMLGVPAAGFITDAIIIAVAQIKRLTEILNCSVTDILPFWGDICYMAYSKYGGDKPERIVTQYERFFRNQAVVPNYDLIPNYPFVEDMAVWKTSSAGSTVVISQANLDYVLAAFQITESDFDTLFSFFKSDTGLNTVFATSPSGDLYFRYLNVLQLLREFSMARMLQLSTGDWCLLRSWMKSLGIDPFANSGSTSYLSATLLFIDKVSRLRNSGLTIANLNYVFADRFTSDADKQAKKTALFTSFQDLRTLLVKINESVITNGTADPKALLKKVGLVLDADDADFMVNFVGNLSGQSGGAPYPFTAEDLDRFLSLLPAELGIGATDPLVAQLIGNPPGLYTVTDKNERLKLINDVYTLAALKGQTRTYLSTTGRVDLAVSETLLAKWIIVNGTHAYDTLLNEAYLGSTGAPDTTQIYAQQALQVLERFAKAAILVNADNLNSDDVDFLETNRTVLGIPDIANLPAGNAWNINPASTPVSVTTWVSLLDWLYERAMAMPSPTGLFTVLGDVLALAGTPQDTPTQRKHTWFTSVMLALQVSEADLTVLVGDKDNPTQSGILGLNFNTGNPHLAAANYRRLLACLDLRGVLEVNMNSCSNIANAVLHAAAQTDADYVVQSVKARYSSDEWLQQAKPANDRLRTGRRDAMVAYLLAFPPNQYRKNWITANDIFETLLIDTEMMPIVKTSRIKQAISSVQLFVDRCVLQQEVNASGVVIALTVDSVAQWNMWRKWYRIWEANRRIFVYPENWIEPDLRDDKSPFFKDLEKFIKQNEINADTMADAYRLYLESLDEVSHLDVIGYYTENVLAANGTTITDVIVHVWGRTRSNPHMYYYRNRTKGVWSAWEKMDTQIDGDNFAPIKWRGRLRLYWLSFMEQVVEKPNTITPDEEAMPSEKYYKIDLCWTELKNGKWQPKQVGKSAFLLTDPYGAFRAQDILYNYQNTFPWTPTMRTYTMKTFQDSFEYLKASMLPYARINTEGDLEIIVHGLKKYITQGNLNSGLWGASPNSGNILSLTETYYYANFKYEEFKGRFTVKNNKIYVDKNNLPHTFYDTLIENFPYRPVDSHYRYERPKTSGYDHIINNNTSGNTLKLLNLSPVFTNAPNPDKYIVFSRQAPSSASYISFPRFFYKDYRNSFYVERLNIGGTTAVLGGGFAAAGGLTPLPDGMGIPYFLIGASIGAGTGFATPANPPVGGGMLPLQSTDCYRFYSFFHYKVDELMNQLDEQGVEGLYDWTFTNQVLLADDLGFVPTYQPTNKVLHYYPLNSTNDVYPKSKIDFSYDSPTAIYNWELFFHIPLLIANKLMQDQKFDEALNWFHYVFNPGRVDSTQPGASRFWLFYPFNQEAAAGIPPIADILNDPATAPLIQNWANDPFKPHLVARTRISAYMKNVVMKYLDNLIAWGDNLFRRDTLESINEASLLYIMAAQLLGRPPAKLPARAGTDPKTYAELVGPPLTLNAFSNAIVPVETILAPTLVSNQYSGAGQNQAPSVMYFCIPPNDKLLSYWDIVADRLFKIRNSQNLDGVERQLALFEPPIDPGLLVRAAAAGISLSDAVNELSAPLPQYRFTIMQQKATEMVQEVKNLGSMLLSAIEKKDAEHLSLLRSSQEIAVMEGIKEVRQYQLQEAQAQVAALEDQRDLVTQRRDYYSGLIERGLNVNEQQQLDSIQASIPLRTAESAARTLSGILYAFPDLKLASPFSFGTTYGGTHLGNLTSAAAGALNIAALINDTKGSMAGIKGGYARRLEDWNQQLKQADTELKQVEKQLVAAQIREAIADKEMQNQQLQFDNARDLDAAMREKFSNEDLYDWMIGQISITYFQSYKLAFDLAKRAERCYKYELGIELSTPFIQFGYWDSLKKGLLAGEGLSYDIKRMDSSYLDQNKRLHEMTKHISLAALDADALIKLRSPGTPVIINIPEWLFDMDYPGHYFRRIKAISISIPCIAGPYSTVSARLTLNSSKYRKNSYPYPYAETPVNNDSRFAYMSGGGQSIATSSAQSDGGVFELNFRDERYLPFEGAGAISQWTLELPSRYASFDPDTISDVIIHIQYTAKYDSALVTGASNNLDALMADAATGTRLPRLFNLQQEFSQQWNAYLKEIESGNMDAVLSLPVQPDRFPLFCKDRVININKILFKGIRKDNSNDASVTIDQVPVSGSPVALVTLSEDFEYLASAAVSINDLDSQYQLRLSLSSAGASTPTQLLAVLNNLDALWFATIYDLFQG